MNAQAWAARQQSDNPLYPYTWSAQYRDGEVLFQTCDGHRSHVQDLDRSRIASLTIWGHPEGPLTVQWSGPGMPEAVILQASVAVALGAAVPARHVTIRAGFQGPGGFDGLLIPEQGPVARVSPRAKGGHGQW